MIMISMDLCSVDWNNDFQYCFHIEDCWSVFTDLLTQSVNKHVPVIHIRKSKAKQSIRHYPNYMRKLFKKKPSHGHAGESQNQSMIKTFIRPLLPNARLLLISIIIIIIIFICSDKNT